MAAAVFIAYPSHAEWIGRVRLVIDKARRIVPAILSDQQG